MSVVPFLRRTVEPLWAWTTGACTLAAWHDLEKSQWLPQPALGALQWQRLTELLRFVHEQNDFYRERLRTAGVDGRDVRTVEDFAQIPVLTKSEVQRHASQMLSHGADRRPLLTTKTGGSTGKALELRFTEEVSQLRNASGRRHKRWAGWEIGEPTGIVWGNPVRSSTLKGRLRDWLLSPVICLDTMSVTPDAVRQFARDWKRVRPTLLFGHAHSLFVLAEEVRNLGIDEVRPRAVIASSMMLLPHERSTIEAVFGVRVVDMYGCEEVGLIASECERHEGLHINQEQVVVEILRDDAAPAAAGENGLVVVTDLLNRAMPFIRYRLEDMATIAGRPCSCGRGLALLAGVTGRVADFLKRTDGSRVAGVSLIENSLTRIAGIDQMQIVQEALDHLCLRLVASAQFTGERREELLSYFRTTFPGARIEMQEVPEIRAEPNGKYRFSICRVPD